MPSYIQTSIKKYIYNYLLVFIIIIIESILRPAPDTGLKRTGAG